PMSRGHTSPAGAYSEHTLAQLHELPIAGGRSADRVKHLHAGNTIRKRGYRHSRSRLPAIHRRPHHLTKARERTKLDTRKAMPRVVTWRRWWRQHEVGRNGQITCPVAIRNLHRSTLDPNGALRPGDACHVRCRAPGTRSV